MSSGVEIRAGSESGARFPWWISYVRSSVEDRIDGAWAPRSWDQPHAARFLVGASWGNGWFASVAGTAHTGWPTTPVTAEGVLRPDGSIEVETTIGARNTARFPVYARLDL